VNLFLAGIGRVDRAAAEAALRALLDRVPFLPGAAVERWGSPSGALAAAWACHRPEQTGGVRYVASREERLALWSGRPIRWAGDEADGRGPLDPDAYLDPADTWSRELDGRCAVVRCDDSTPVLEVFCDRLGAYPLFAADAAGGRWVSNNAELLRELRGTRDRDPLALAGLLGGGWSLRGDPVWSDVRRLDRGAVHRLADERARDELLPAPEVAAMFDAGLDAARAARLLVAGTRALADWPGRPSFVPVTGGRDSRVVLGAALAAGIEFETRTGGAPESPDVMVGRRLAEVGGVPHGPIEDYPHGSHLTDWRRAARVVELTAAGTASLADAAGFPLGPHDGPLSLWHTGQGGEIARAYYGTGEGLDRDRLAERLYRAFVGRRPGRAEILGAEGRALVHGEIAGWVDEQLAARVAPVDVPDAFYLHRRMATWAAPSHGCVEWVRDTTAPLWSHRLLPDELGAPARDRARHLFHLRVLEQLAPQLVDVPFEDRRPWPARRGTLALRLERARSLALKAAAEARRRTVGRRGPAPGADPFAAILPEIREAVLSQPSHPAWQVLDRGRVERLLSAPPGSLDEMSRYYAWRLATVFGPEAS
jgi:hypothetical protein